MAAPRVFIDIGHGGSDPGAVANGLVEKDVNLVTGIALNAELVRHGVETMLSRSEDTKTYLATTCPMVNKFNPAYAISLHHNSGGGDGSEVFYHYGGGKGKELALAIIEELKAIGQNTRGAKTKKNANGKDYYMFIRETTPPAVVVEVAFLDTKDHEFVDTEEEQKRNGVAIAKAVLKKLGIEWKPEEKKQIVLGEFDTLREADDYIGGLLAKMDYAMAQADLAKLAAADVKNELLKAKVVG